MDNRPIGVFDSGIGGLTVVKELIRQLPNESIMYFGDLKRMPYGSRSKEEIIDFSLEISKFLISKNVKMIVIACNTATAYAVNILNDLLDIPVIGIIEYGAKLASEITKNNKIGIIATEATIESGEYVKTIKQISELSVYTQKCPLLVPLIEREKYKNLDTILKSYIEPLVAKNIDTLILGCTHYPIIKSKIEKLYSDLNIVDPASELVRNVKIILNKNDMLSENENSSYIFFLSSNKKRVKMRIHQILGIDNIIISEKDMENDI